MSAGAFRDRWMIPASYVVALIFGTLGAPGRSAADVGEPRMGTAHWVSETEVVRDTVDPPAIHSEGTVHAQAQGDENTSFLETSYTFSGLGGWWVQGFTLGGTRTMVIRFASDYAADAAVIAPDQLSNFQNNQYFLGYGVLDDQFGYRTITLPAGQYYLAARNQVSSGNGIHLELDYDLQLGGHQRTDTLGNATYVNKNGGWFYQSFTLGDGPRYFIDGCNSGGQVYLMPASEYANFAAHQTFRYYTDYSGQDLAFPGQWELNLPPGEYYLVVQTNTGDPVNRALTYVLEQWTPDPVPPAAPSGLQAAAISPTQVRLTWSDNSGNENGFLTEAKPLNGSFQLVQGQAPRNATSTTIEGLAPATTYVFRVYAANAFGSSGYTNEATAATPDIPPAAPGGVSVTAISGTKVQVNWTDNSGNEDGFVVQLKEGAGDYQSRAAVAANVVTDRITGLKSLTSYTFRVYAFNEAGNSNFSSEQVLVTPPPPPATPTGLQASPVSSTQIRLGWTDNASDETGYVVEVRGTGDYQPLNPLPAGSQGTDVTGLQPGTTYSFRVAAINQNGSSDYSNEASATTAPAPVLTPSNFRVSALKKKKARLTWTPASGDETSFHIEGGLSPDSLTELTVSRGGSTSVVVGKLIPRKVNYFRVRAERNGQFSDYTPTLGVKGKK
jgi:hypothetical protein